MSDVIQRLRELRQSARSSVVHGAEDQPAPERPTIPQALDTWLVDLILEQLTRPEGPELSLLVLSGNAGDGKSHLLRAIRSSLKQKQLSPEQVDWLLDATQSDEKNQSSVERLDAFFRAFTDDANWKPQKFQVIAINTGAVVQFLAHDHARQRRFQDLDKVLSAQLGIGSTSQNWDEQLLTRFDRVLVVDLDKRMLVGLNPEKPQFFDQILDLLDADQANGILSDTETNCRSCPQASHCPVFTNLIALKKSRVRSRLKQLLLDVTLEDRMHLGPRGLWHLAYQMTVGGLDAARLAAGQPLLSCAEISGLTTEERSQGLFYNALFEVASTASGGDVPTLLNEFLRVDPYGRFSLSSHEEALISGLAPDEDGQRAQPHADFLGVPPAVLRGSERDAMARSRAAVRRAFFLGAAEPDPERHGWLATWVQGLERCREQMRKGQPVRVDDIQTTVVRVLGEMFQPAAQHTNALWQLKLPWRGRKELFTPWKLKPSPPRKQKDIRVLGPDLLRPEEPRRLTRELVERLDTYPLSLPVRLHDGLELRATWSLYRLLMRVQSGYVAGSLDPERIQHLERIGASIGADVAVREGVVVLEGEHAWRCTSEDGEIYVFPY